MGMLLEAVLGWLMRLLALMVEQPFGVLYRDGPAAGAYGFWQAKANADVCAELTAVPAAHWSVQAAECAALIERRAHSWVLLVYAALYVLVAWRLLWCDCRRQRSVVVIRRAQTHAAKPTPAKPEPRKDV